MMCNDVQYVLGLMSGTSLDGLDLAHCRFGLVKGRWHYRILEAETISFTKDWQQRLQMLDRLSAGDLALADVELGHLMGKLAKGFIDKHRLNPGFIASHGQTIFHQPHLKWTTQIGNGATIAAETGLPVVCDFRSTDVALGGQGAPLVPIGDRLLFPEFTFCLNLGGFANISFEREGSRIAFDICPVNMVLNSLAGMAGKVFDDRGNLARSGTLLPGLLESLNQLAFYHQAPPKSLGKEWVEEYIRPLMPDPGSGIRDQLATFCEHIAIQVGKNTGTNGADRLLVTGGGALNTYLVERIRHHAAPEVLIPDILTIQFKEALIFAFLGLLRWRGEVNCLSSVTGASRDNIGGAIYSG